jgi:hypothetical protein
MVCLFENGHWSSGNDKKGGETAMKKGWEVKRLGVLIKLEHRETLYKESVEILIKLRVFM